MSDHRYFRYTLKGNLAPHEAVRALGTVAADAQVVRIDFGGGQTHVYLAVLTGPTMKAEGAQVPEIPERDVMDLNKR